MLRFVTAASLFDGHDAAINLYRRLLIQNGNEVIHLGHNRSVAEVVRGAVQEDVDAIAVSSYQGGHREFFGYLLEYLKQEGAQNVAVFGGGGGVITPSEVGELESMGVDKIFTPADGRSLGLNGIVREMMKRTVDRKKEGRHWNVSPGRELSFSKQLTYWLRQDPSDDPSVSKVLGIPVIGFTGTGGSGKSSLIDELIVRYRLDFPEHRMLLLGCDPTKRKTKGSLLGDRIRMNAIYESPVFLRSLSVLEEERGLHPGIRGVFQGLSEYAGSKPDLILLESSGIGQADTEITRYSDRSIYVMTPEYGAESQLEKISMLDFADLIVVNKMDRQGAQDALLQVRRTFRRFRKDPQKAKARVCGACAARFQDVHTHVVYRRFLSLINEVRSSMGADALQSSRYGHIDDSVELPEHESLIPRHRSHYLAQIAETVRNYNRDVQAKARALKHYEALQTACADVADDPKLVQLCETVKNEIPDRVFDLLKEYKAVSADLHRDSVTYQVRGRSVRQTTKTQSLSGTEIPKVAVPSLSSLADTYVFCAKENFPGFFPFTAGAFPFKRSDEIPKRMFAGEGGPDRTNARFHYLCRHEKAKRLSTAFDSVTLYGADPDERPDVFGKIGESGVSIATLDDMKRLYDGFDLCDPNTSVSMTINGPAPMMLALFFNTAIDQQVTLFEQKEGRFPNDEEWKQIKARVLKTVRGTVQADILKEDQAQNTCIFSTEFALRMMADIQEYFVRNDVGNFYSVSVSGYHIAEAGATPITQLAITLANAFTYVELYRARGMKTSDFAPNLSFFFSNGLDPEYAVIGRVARRIWAIAMRDFYGVSPRGQKLKYHIQTSGRSLHAEEIDFNDIRTTIQALLALMDNCNSLHTNAYDEAITTPTEASVRRAVAIQLIGAFEAGVLKNENPLQGSFFVSELTDRVEAAVLKEFDRLSDRGGVLPAMEYQYQRNRIQNESFEYEQKKSDGSLPIVGVNTFVKKTESDKPGDEIPLTRSSKVEKQAQLDRLQAFHKKHESVVSHAKEQLRNAALDPNASIFEVLMDVSRVLSLGQMSDVLFECGGRYRRNM